MDMNINFPNLNISLENVGKTFDVFGLEIAYYGVILGIAMIAGIFMAAREAKITGQDANIYWDLAIYAVIFSIIGARLYYVIFSWDIYSDNLKEIFNIREGGLAIFGGLIAGVITVFVFAKAKKLKFAVLLDTSVVGVLAGQIIGRWGNFFNREAFGDYTNNIFAMQLPVSAVRNSDITTELANNICSVAGIDYIQVHPTFLYESIWNIGVLLVLFAFRKYKKFNGEMFLMYMTLYGIGRIWIERLRTDQLLALIIGLPVSQLLSTMAVVIAISIIVFRHIKQKE